MNLSVLPTVIGILGLVIISGALFMKSRKREDMLFVLGGICLLTYSIAIGNAIFIVLQAVFIVSALYDFSKRKK